MDAIHTISGPPDDSGPNNNGSLMSFESHWHQMSAKIDWKSASTMKNRSPDVYKHRLQFRFFVNAYLWHISLFTISQQLPSDLLFKSYHNYTLQNSKLWKLKSLIEIMTQVSCHMISLSCAERWSCSIAPQRRLNTRCGDNFRSGDLLVLNDNYVLSNTLVSQHGDKSAQVALYGHEPDGTTVVEIKSEQQSSVKPGLILRSMNDDRLNCILLEPQPDRLWKVTFESIELLMPTLGRYGTNPLNPTYWKTAPHACLRYLPVRIRQSTWLWFMLTAAFAGKDFVMRSYAEIVEKRVRHVRRQHADRVTAMTTGQELDRDENARVIYVTCESKHLLCL